MKNALLLVVVFTTVFFLGCTKEGGDTPSDSVEIFGNWTPDFSNQTGDFIQTRNGNLGTQQTRTIAISISTSSNESSEEALNEDINNDGDLFDQVTITSTKYTASEGLGSYSVESISMSLDNDMVLKIGNDSYPLSLGRMSYEPFIMVDENSNLQALNCEGKTIYEYTFVFYTNSIKIDGNEKLSGVGKEISFYLESTEESFTDGNYFSILNRINEVYLQNFTTFEEFYAWNDPNPDIRLSTDDCFVFNLAQNAFGVIEVFESDYDNYVIDQTYLINETNANLEVQLKQDGGYIIALNGAINNLGLPVSFYFNGYMVQSGFNLAAGKTSRNLKRKTVLGAVK